MSRLPHSIDDLIVKKNHQLQDMERVRVHGKPEEVKKLALGVAFLELKIADELIRLNKPEEAVVNLVSRASCLMLAGRARLAMRAYDRAKKATKDGKYLRWIEKQQEEIANGDGNERRKQ